VTTHAQRLSIISRAWGRKADGWVFFPWIDREEQMATGKRQKGFHDGPAFKWPEDKAKILAHMAEHEQHDLYWCPSVFEGTSRTTELAADEHALWADLDGADPRQVEPAYAPTIAWESSPGRFQALWIIGQGDIQGASWPGNENQKLTYFLGADPSGWDTTQLLRVPAWPNYKPEYRGTAGEVPEGTILWTNGRTYLPDDFSDLPEIQGALPSSALENAVTDEIDSVDRHAVIGRIRLKINKKARDILGAREVSGDRSESLWYLIRCLADVGCSVPEIVAIVRETPWNKFADRADETKRLILEASKAVAKRDPATAEAIEEDRAERPAPTRLSVLIKHLKPPKWLVEGILTEGSVGFVAGQPKSYKSWVGLDLAISVATGADFLNHFRVLNPGPVLLIQEEDSAIMLKTRATKIWAGKSADTMVKGNDGIYWEPGENAGPLDPDINAYVQQSFIISDPAWQEWLDETLAEGMDGVPYRLVLIDTLMMVAGEVDENRSVEMTTKIFKPLKVLMRKHNVTLQVVHHMRKSDPKTRERGGQLMLGSVANHAWSEDSLYLQKNHGGDVYINFESKSAPEADYLLSNVKNRAWTPTIVNKDMEEQERASDRKRGSASRAPGSSGRPQKYPTDRVNAVLEALTSGKPTGATVREVSDALGCTYQTAKAALVRVKSVRDSSNHWWPNSRSTQG